MSDRVFSVCVLLSLAIHALVLVAGSQARIEAARPDTPIQVVRVRLKGPATRTLEPAPPPVRKPPAVSAPPPIVSTPPALVAAPPPVPPVSTAQRPPEPSTITPAVVGTEPATLAAVSEATAVPARATGAEGEDEERLARYVESLRSRVESRKRYPPLARKRSVEGRVIARLIIRADGDLDSVELRGTNSPLLRRATRDAIRAAAPYPAPPDGALTIELPIDYSLRDAS